MSTTTPINGLPVPDENSPNDPPIHFQALASRLDTRLIPRFANANLRDQAITAPEDGMYAFMLDDDRLWRYDSLNKWWTWDKAAQGVLTKAEYTPAAAGDPVLANTMSNNNYGVLNPFIVPTVKIPPARSVSIEFHASFITDNVPSMYAITAYMGTVTPLPLRVRHGFELVIANLDKGVHVARPDIQLPAGTYRFEIGVQRLGGDGGLRFISIGREPAQFIIRDNGGV